MHMELVKLAHLQDVEQETVRLQAQVAGYSQNILRREADLQQTTRALEGNRQALANELNARRRMESDTDDLRQKSRRYKAQLDSVQSDSQAKALEHQIAFCKQEIDRLEELELTSLMQTESLESAQRALDETLANQKLALEKEQAAAQLGRNNDEAKLRDLNSERNEIRASVEPSLLASYDRLSTAKKIAVAHVEAQRCSACQMMVRPQKWNEIRGGALHFCESCGRFLFYNPAVDLTDAIPVPPATKKPSGPARHGQSGAAPTGSDPHSRED